MDKRRFVRWLFVPALASASLVASATAAGAHAAIVSSTPAAGEELGSAPGVVSLTFSEPLIEALSRAVVVDPNGLRHKGGPTSERKMEVRLATNAPGVYRVEWKTVSPVDGHSLEGQFFFGVGVKPGGEAETNLAPRPRELTLAVFRALEYAGLLAAAGAILLSAIARRKPMLDWVRPSLRVPLALALVSGIAVVSGEALLASSTLSAAPAFFRTLPGLARLLRLAFEAAALMFAPLLAGAGVNVLLSMVALSAAGHAAAIRPALWGIGTNAIHLVAAGMWAGGIIVLVLIALRAPEWRKLLDRFTPFAIPAFLVTVVTGVLRAAQELTGLADLWGSPYGRVIFAKSAGVLVMIPLSVLAWRRVIEKPRAEAIVAGAVIAAAGLLAAFPLPPGRVAEAEQAAVKGPFVSALPRPEDLTLGAYAGEVLLGITLRPGEPGTNEVLLYLLPIEGEEEAGEVALSAVVEGRDIDLERCGPTCRRGTTNLRGGERIALRLTEAKRGQGQVTVPSLPAPDATGLLDKMNARMRVLKTLRIEETLRPAKSPTSTSYWLEAPDRLRMQVSSGFESVRIGEVSYQRESPSAPWRVERGVPPIEAPFFIWGSPPFASAHILGSESVEGIDLQIVGFFEDRGGLPIWFKLWLDAEGLVHIAEMRAQGHFMDHRYFDFDAPFTIEPPVGV
jgi:copper transport protein